MGREMRKAKRGNGERQQTLKVFFEKKSSNLLLWEFLKIYTYMIII